MLPFQQPGIIAYSELLAASFRHWLGRDLLSPDSSISLSHALYHAPFVLVSHGMEADPIFRYANLAAQKLWGYGWEEFTALPSRLSAEPMAREERERLLERAARFGYVDNYQGIRIAKSGRCFRIGDTILWNVVDESGALHGQAAMFTTWTEETH